MLISLEANKAYIDTLVRAQAFQICASRDPSCEIKGIHRMLVDLYVAKMTYDEGGVLSHVAAINRELDKRISEANGVTRSEIMKFISAMRDDTWMHNKMEEISDKLSHIQQIQERIESNTVCKEVAKPKQTEAIRKPVVPLATVTASAVKKGKKVCRKCGKEKEFADYYCDRDGNPTHGSCKECILLEKKTKRFAKVNSDGMRQKIKEYIAGLPSGKVFTNKQIAEAVGDDSHNHATTATVTKGMVTQKTVKRKGFGRHGEATYTKV